MSEAPPAFIGTAGWSVPAGYASCFPEAGSHLQRYAARLNAVEINSSFYRPHRRATYERWAGSVTDGFRFSVKVPKAITHDRRMISSSDLLARLAEETGGLGRKLGALLVQLPPSLPFDADVAQAFFADLRRCIDVAVACEPRHASWFSDAADSRLAMWEVARVAADPARVPGADEPGGWSGFVYYRLHGSPRIYYSNYDDQAVAAIRRQVHRHGTADKPAWCIFDNTAASAALGNALALAA